VVNTQKLGFWLDLKKSRIGRVKIVLTRGNKNFNKPEANSFAIGSN